MILRILKKSIRKKLFFITSSLILFTIILLILTNSFFLSFFYEKMIKRDILKYSYELKKFNLDNDFIEKLEEIEIKENFAIDIANNPIGFSKTRRQMMGFMYLRSLTTEELKKIQSGKIVTKDIKNMMTGNVEFSSFFLTADDNIILIRSSHAEVKKAVKIANQFILIVGSLIFFINFFISYFLSKSFTKPIMQLKNFTDELAKMNFDVEYKIKTGDEIEELGNSFNYLSNELKINIQNMETLTKQLKEELENRKFEEKNRIDFFANVSHELKTPISLIKAFGEGLIDNIEDEKDRKYYANTIVAEVDKMAEVISKMLRLVKMKKLDHVFSLQEFEINDLINKTMNRYKIDLKNKKIKYVQIYSKKSLIAKGDKSEIEQVLDNLISNALNNINECGKLEIKLEETDRKVKFSIYNSGSKIENDEMEKIWIPFFKNDKSRNRRYGGTGLGLSIVSEILKKHQSDFGVKNFNKGVIFYFNLNKG